MTLLTISLFTILDNSAYGESEIIANSFGLENSTILELKNSRGNNVEIDSVRIWLSGENSFQSFKTEQGWMGKNTPQGVIIFSSQDLLKPGEVVKFGIKTSVEKPVINWKALDTNGNIIKTAQTITDTEITDVKEIIQPKSVAIKDDSTFRLIPTKLSPGSDFRVIGNNFVPNQSLNFYINEKITNTFSTDSNGSFLITNQVPESTNAERTQFLISDSVGAETEISIRLTEQEKRTIGQSLQLVFDETPTTVKRGQSITLQGVATPENTLTITSSQNTLGIISIETITTGSDGKWSFENLFSPELELETITIKISDGKDLIERNIDVISSKLIRINSEEPRYEPGDIITFTGNAIANTDLLYYLEDPKGSEIISDLITVDSSGIITFEIQTELSQMKGTYVLHANQGKENGISVVGLGEEPVEVIVVDSTKLNYNTNEKIKIQIQGQPNATVAIIILDDSSKEKISDTVNLGADGFHTYEIESNELSVGTYVVEVRHGKARGDTVFSIGLTQGSGVIMMQTTKDEYNAGESILLMGNTGANSLLTLTLYNSEGTVVKQVEVFTSKNGAFQSDKFRIPNDPEIGQWSIKAKSGGNTAEHSFTVTKILEGVAVLVDKESRTYSLSEIITISGAGANPSTAIDIKFLDSGGNEISDKLTIYATNTGAYITSIPVAVIIPSDLVPGEFTILVEDPLTSSSTTITVE
tara:strand:- start:1165 stop:3270 length:2106 start_codon:yes stop_codon:yes gene_type:complete